MTAANLDELMAEAHEVAQDIFDIGNYYYGPMIWGDEDARLAELLAEAYAAGFADGSMA